MKNKESLEEKLTLRLLSIGAILYSTFVYQKVWNWFIASYLFSISYWEMMLGVMIIRFIVIPKRSYSEIRELTEKADSLSFVEKLENRIFSLFLFTLALGLFFSIKLLFTYFS